MKELRISLIVLCLAVLQVGSVRKSDDPIANTQTSPIAYKDKMEETKDGEKSAPTPFFRHYEKERFLIDPPVSKSTGPSETAEEDLPYVPKLGEPIPELRPDKAEEKEWWFNDADSETKVQEPAPEDVRQG